MLAVVTLPYTWQQFSPLISVWFFVTGLLLAFPVLMAAWYFPTMRYWIGRDELVIKFGPFINERIPLDSIRSVRWRHLQPRPLLYFRFPGLALLYMSFLGGQRAKMCATSSTRDLLLLITESERYIITPDDMFAFVDILAERAGDEIRVSANFDPARRPDSATL